MLLLSQRTYLAPLAPGCASSRPERRLSTPRDAAARAKQHVAPAQTRRSCRLRWTPRQTPPPCRAQADDSVKPEVQLAREAGEDAGVFSLESQSATSWAIFTAVLGTVLAILYAVPHHSHPTPPPHVPLPESLLLHLRRHMGCGLNVR